MDIFNTKPELRQDAEFIKVVRRARETGDYTFVLELTEKAYEKYFIDDATAIVLLAAADYDCLDAFKAKALYLEAFAEAGRRYAKILNEVRSSSYASKVVDYLAKRPPQVRNIGLVEQLRRQWLNDIGNDLEPVSLTKNNDAALIVLFEGAEPELVHQLIDDEIKRSDRAKVLVACHDRKLCARLKKAMPLSFVELVEFVSAEKVDLSEDPQVFAACDTMAAAIVEQLDFAGGHELSLKRVADAFKILARDALTPNVRFERLLARCVEARHPSRIICVGPEQMVRAVAVWADREVVRATMKNQELRYSAVPIGESAISSVFNLKQSIDLRSFDFPDLRNTQFVVYHLKAADRQSIGNAQGLVNRLAEKHHLLFEFGWTTEASAKAHLPQIFEGAIGAAIASGKAQVTWATKRTAFSYWASYPGRIELLSAYRNVINSCAHETGRVGTLALAASLAPFDKELRTFFMVLTKWRDVVERAKAVLVSPGRSATALALTIAAHAGKTSSYELQNGTISATGRFVRPITDQVFVTDEFSYKIYRDYLSCVEEQLNLVGSPRLDAALRPARGVSSFEAKKINFGESIAQRSPIALFASQPLAMSVCREIFQTVVQGVAMAGEDWRLVVRVHPTETADHIDLYKSVMETEGFPTSRLLPASGNAFDIPACDVVLTYYSTVGLEGLSLSSRVICVAPVQGSAPSFDICMLGAEGPVTSGKQLSSLLLTAPPPKTVSGVVTEATSARRIAAVIGNGR